MSTDITSPQPGRYVEANSLDIYYEEYGAGETLLLIHGGTATSQMWQPHIPSFAQHFRVIAPDSRGHGRTANPIGELSYRLMADDVAAFVQAVGLSQPLICGYSDGGQIALEIGMHYPQLAKALVVGGAFYKLSELYCNSLKEIGLEGPGLVNLEQTQRQWPDFVEHWRIQHSPLGGPDYWQKLLQQISTMWWTPLDYTAKDFQKIIVPTLILMGDRDGLIPIEEAVEMYQLILKAELAIIPNATHFTALGNVELFTKMVLDFLMRHSSYDKPQSGETDSQSEG